MGEYWPKTNMPQRGSRRRGRGRRGGRFVGRQRFQQRRGFNTRSSGRGNRRANGNNNGGKNLVPPPSFTRSNYGRAAEQITLKKTYTNADLASMEDIETAWAAGTATTKTSVISVYVNVSNVALDNSTPATPTATTSKRTITHISGFSVQGHSTATSIHLAGGRKEYNATRGYQRNTRVVQTESRPQVGMFHTRKLRLPPKARMVNQKGFKLKTVSAGAFSAISVDYAHVGDVMVSVGSAAPNVGTIASIDFTATVHTSPNPDYVESFTTESPPDFYFELQKDPSLILQGYNDGPTETTLKVVVDKEIRVYQAGAGRFLARMNIDNVIPRPAPGMVYRLSTPISINKDTNISTSFSLAKFFINPIDPDTTLGFFAFEGRTELIDNYNKGSVSVSRIKVPSGLTLEPRAIITAFDTVQNEKGAPFKMGDRVIYHSNFYNLYEGEEEDPDFSVVSEDDHSIIGHGAPYQEVNRQPLEMMSAHFKNMRMRG